MPSKAKDAFGRALEDVDNVMWFHQNEGGDKPGKRPAYFQSLNKSAIVLICAAWETYVEDVIIECAYADIELALNPSDMLRSLRKLAQSHVRGSEREDTWMQVAGEGWRNLTRSIVQAKVSKLNTPSPTNVTDIFASILGIKDIKANWSWKKNNPDMIISRLQQFIVLRGGIAHGERMKDSVKKSHVDYSRDLIVRLIDLVEITLVQNEMLAAP